MRQLFLLSALSLSLSFATAPAARAESACFIYADQGCPKQSKITPDTWFPDDSPVTQGDVNACLKRADDYRAYCGSDTAQAYFSAGTNQAKDDSWVKIRKGYPIEFRLAPNAGLTLGDGASLHMQTDGNLVLTSAAGPMLWNSQTWGHDCASETCGAVLQGDGNLVVQINGGPQFSAFSKSANGPSSLRYDPSDPQSAISLVGDDDGVTRWRPIGTWHYFADEAVITGVRFDVGASPVNSAYDYCLSMAPGASPNGYSMYGVGGFTELLCIASMHNKSRVDQGHRVIDLSEHPIYVPAGVSLNCGHTTVEGFSGYCSLNLAKPTPGEPRYRILRLPFLDQSVMPSMAYQTTYYQRWAKGDSLHVVGGIPYVSSYASGSGPTTVDSCVQIVRQGGAVVDSACAPTQHAGPGLDFDSPDLLHFDFRVEADNLLSSTCSVNNARFADCATYAIAEIPGSIPEQNPSWRISLADFGQTAAPEDYCERYATMQDANEALPDPAGQRSLAAYTANACQIAVTGEPEGSLTCSHEEKVRRCLRLLNK